MMGLPPADVELCLPLPNAEIDAKRMHAVKASFMNEGFRVKLATEDEYPVSASWADLLIVAAAFLAGAAGEHYVDKILDAFDAFAKAKITELNLSVRFRNRQLYVNVPLRDRDQGRRALGNALWEMRTEAETPGVTMYRLDSVSISDGGDITCVVLRWLPDGSRAEGAMTVATTGAPDYGFWEWVYLTDEPAGPGD